MPITTTATDSNPALARGDSAPSAEIAATAPGRYRVIRRNGKVTTFDKNKVKLAVTKAFLAVEGGNAAASSRIHQAVDCLTEQVTHALKRLILRRTQGLKLTYLMAVQSRWISNVCIRL